MKGQIQITIPIAMGLIAFIVSPVAAFFGAQMTNKEAQSKISERTAVLETSVPRIEKSIDEIKDSIKSIEKTFLNIRNER